MEITIEKMITKENRDFTVDDEINLEVSIKVVNHNFKVLEEKILDKKNIET